MQVILSTLGLQLGDEVIASPVSCLASNQPFATKGLKVIWADVNPVTGTLCPKDVETKITVNTRAIFHNHFCGYVGEIDAINELGKKYSIPVIDDGIEAFGSEYKGNRIGNVGTDITVFSFQTVRLPNTIEGGALSFKDKALFEKALLIRDYGIDRTKFRSIDGEINPYCDVQFEGYGGLMSEVNSYLGLCQLKDITGLLSIQRSNGLRWNDLLIKDGLNKPLGQTSDSKPNYWVFGLLSKNKTQTIDIFRSRGYYATGVHLNNNLYSVFNNKIFLPGVHTFINQFVALPSGWWVEDINFES